MKFNGIFMNNYFNEICFLFSQKTALHAAVEKDNIEIVQLLLSIKNINVDIKTILYSNLFIKFQN